MAAPTAPISLYATRWKAFLIVLGSAGLLLVGLLSYFVWPTPVAQTYPSFLYQDPFKTIIFIVWTLMCASMLAWGLYLTLTARPLLQLSATSLIYRPFPRPTRTIVWDDVESLTAFAIGGTRPRSPARMLTLRFTLKPHHLSADHAPQKLRLDINMQLLSLSADELIEMIGVYHHLYLLRTPNGLRFAMTDR